MMQTFDSIMAKFDLYIKDLESGNVKDFGDLQTSIEEFVAENKGKYNADQLKSIQARTLDIIEKIGNVISNSKDKIEQNQSGLMSDFSELKAQLAQEKA